MRVFVQEFSHNKHGWRQLLLTTPAETTEQSSNLRILVPNAFKFLGRNRAVYYSQCMQEFRTSRLIACPYCRTKVRQSHFSDTVPALQSTVGHRALPLAAACMWNSLPSHVTAALLPLSPSSDVVLSHISSHFLISLFYSDSSPLSFVQCPRGDSLFWTL